MARRENLKAKALEEDEEEERRESKSVIYSISSDDSDKEEERKQLRSTMYDESDDEINDDPMLRIVVEAQLVRTEKLDQNSKDFGVVSITRADDGAVELPSKESEVVSTGPDATKLKKMKKQSVQNQDVGDESVIARKPIDKDKTNENLEAIEKEEKVEGVVSEETVDPDSVDLTDNIVMRKLLRGPRYFDPPDSGWSTCFNCGEEGHMAVICPSLTKKKKPCFVCGSLDHGAKQCSKGQDCFICKQVGHRAKDCPEKKKGGQLISKICLKCGDAGHDMFLCMSGYSEHDLKEIKCYICNNFGHLCCVNSVDNNPKEVSCYKCGGLGHAGSACFASPSSCYKCGEVGHFARECTPSVKENGNGASSSCYRCGEAGHFARECNSSAKTKKRSCEKSTPNRKGQREKIKSTPNEREKGRKRKKPKSEDKAITTPRKSKPRGGWITEGPEEFSSSFNTENRQRSRQTPSKEHKISSITSGSYHSSSHSVKKVQKHYPSTPPLDHRYMAPRFGNSYSAPPYNHLGTLQYDHRYTASGFDNPYSAAPFNNNGTLPYDPRYVASGFKNSYSAAPYNNSWNTGNRRHYGW